MGGASKHPHVPLESSRKQHSGQCHFCQLRLLPTAEARSVGTTAQKTALNRRQTRRALLLRLCASTQDLGPVRPIYYLLAALILVEEQYLLLINNFSVCHFHGREET
jgi:hypothetical protein